MAKPFGTRSFSALTAFLLCTAAALPAEAANPELTARAGGVEDEQARSGNLRIEAVDVAVRLHGGIAETLVTTRFHNPGKNILEGRFKLQMPDGSIVTGYALDVEGEMIEGVLLDQLEARRAYEAQVRQNIDPGLGEVSRGFQFSTRVYPVGPASSRTVRVRFVTPLSPGQDYVLPLDSEAKIGRLSVSVTSSGTAVPDVQLPGGPKLEWTRKGNSRRLAWQAEAVALKDNLSIAPAAGAGTIAVGAGPQGERFFEIGDSAPAAGGEAARPRNVALLWDRSLSRADDGLADEIALLRAWLEAVRPASIELILFDASGVERVKLADAASVAARLAKVGYRGASSYAPLSAQEIRADACLLFTDGLVTIESPRNPHTFLSGYDRIERGRCRPTRARRARRRFGRGGGPPCRRQSCGDPPAPYFAGAAGSAGALHRRRSYRRRPAGRSRRRLAAGRPDAAERRRRRDAERHRSGGVGARLFGAGDGGGLGRRRGPVGGRPSRRSCGGGAGEPRDASRFCSPPFGGRSGHLLPRA